MESMMQLMRSRRSVRSFDGRPLRSEDLENLQVFARKVENPYGIPVEFRLLDAAEHKLSCPVLTGETLYLGAKLARIPHAEEAIGYSLEKLMLYALSLGIGSVWIGGTMNRASFERLMDLSEEEFMPCITPLGYPAKKPSLRETMMRKGVHADQRRSFETLFFDGALDVPLTESAAGRLAAPLEMVRLAPSAVNKQPWRVITGRDVVHFYLKQAKGFSDGGAGNMQKIDMGIALCHFALGAEASGLQLRFSLDNPGIPVEDDMQYIASYFLS